VLKPNRRETIGFKSENNNPSSLSSNYINCLYQDSTGAVWVGTNNGLDRFDRSLKKFSRMGKFNVLAMAKEHGNNVWLGTAKGLLLFDLKLRKVLHTYKHCPTDANSIKNNIITSIFPSGKKLYIGTDGGFCWLDLESQQFIPRAQAPSKPLYSTRVLTMQRLSKSSLLIATLGGGLFRFEERTESATPFANKTIITERINAL
ncbi:MAG: two-component regulator propeller domain-containing protein, partial [Flammeovirgaceae bacterium]